jgi:hypothetical protein
MPQDLLPWNNLLKQGDILSRTRDNLTAMVWRDKTDVHILTKMHHPPTNDNFCEKHENALKPQIIQHCNKHTGCSDLGDTMTNSYSIQHQAWKWEKNYFFTS